MNAPEAKAVAEPYVHVARDARGVVTLTMNRPQQFNALSEEMMAALQADLDAVARDDSARVVVLAAVGKASLRSPPWLRGSRSVGSLGASRATARCGRPRRCCARP